jgi:hypothetical protein
MGIRLVRKGLGVQLSAFEEKEDSQGEMEKIQKHEVERIKRGDHPLDEAMDVLGPDVDDEKEDAEEGHGRKNDSVDEVSLAEFLKRQRIENKMNDEEHVKDVKESEVEGQHLEKMGEILEIRSQDVEAIKSEETAQ